MKSVRISTDIFGDSNMLLIDTETKADSIIVIWFKILVLAGALDSQGWLKDGDAPYSIKMLAAVFRRSPSIVERSVRLFLDYGMLEDVDGCLHICNWDKHQTRSEMVEDIRKYNREAQRRSRKRREKPAENVNDMSMTESENVNDMSMTVNDMSMTESENVNDMSMTVNDKKEKGTFPLFPPSPERKEKVIPKEKKDSSSPATPSIPQERKNTLPTASAVCVRDFEAVWSRYPRKEGKAKAKAAYETALAAGVDPEQIDRGLDAYLRYIARAKVQRRYIRSGGEWFAGEGWTDDYVSGAQPTATSFDVNEFFEAAITRSYGDQAEFVMGDITNAK